MTILYQHKGQQVLNRFHIYNLIGYQNMLRIILLIMFLFLNLSSVQAQHLKAKQMAFINDFVKKLNKTDTTDLSILITYNELINTLTTNKELLVTNKGIPLIMFKKAEEDKRLLKYLENYSWDCYYVKNNRIRISERELKWLHDQDSKTLYRIQEELRKRNDSITDSFYQRYLDYREYIMSKKDTTNWRKLLGCTVCEQELLSNGDYANEFYDLPRSYKWVVGRFRKYMADNLDVKLDSVELPGIYNETGLITSNPILVFKKGTRDMVRLKIHILYIHNKWKMYRYFEYK